MCNPAFLMLLAKLVALALLVLVTLSTPFIRVFYFLHTSAAGGVKFGVLGYCNDAGDFCAKKQIGYDYSPELLNPLPMTLILYPIAAGLTLLSVLSLIPHFFARRRREAPRWCYILFGLLSTLAFLASAAAFGLSVWLFTVAMRRFKAEGATASYGPSIWMSLVATVVLLLVALNAGCGTCIGGRCGRQARHHVYTY